MSGAIASAGAMVDRYKLHFGPHRTPGYTVGVTAECQARGEVAIVT